MVDSELLILHSSRYYPNSGGKSPESSQTNYSHSLTPTKVGTTDKYRCLIWDLGDNMKIILWIIAIIFIVGLLTITGVFKLIF
ncbi:membrane protein [Yersinia frederiksenii]|nr:membrane protein [Yersinia frederiksenii]